MIKEFYFPATTFKLTLTSTALTLSTLQKGVPPGIRARVTSETAPVRVALGGATASATLGHYYDMDSEFFLFGYEELDSASFIRGGGTDAVAQVTVMHEVER